MIKVWFNNGTAKCFLNKDGYFDERSNLVVRDFKSGKKIFIPLTSIQMWSGEW